MTPLLDIRGLSVTFTTAHGGFTAVEDVDLTVEQGEVVAVVGESGSGKSVAMLAVMGLLPWTAAVRAERMQFAGRDLQTLTAAARREIIGRDMAMIFQEPMTSLNPCFTVGFQLTETLAAHTRERRAERRRHAARLLAQVGIPEPEARLAAYPHQLSGGMNQRVSIAMAIACRPKLLIADEPTTALDVTIQAQILELLARLQEESGMALVLITHDMGVVAETAQRVVVQYAGQQVESRNVRQLFRAPRHPYTKALLDALPGRHSGRRLPSIPGVVPGQLDRPDGCLFHPRCGRAEGLCRERAPSPSAAELGFARCHFPLPPPEPGA